SRKKPGSAHETCGVQVVSARMHLARVPGDELLTGTLLHRQGIHVAAQQHDRTRTIGRAAASTQHADDRAERRSSCHFEWKVLQGSEDTPLRRRELEAVLRNLMEFAPRRRKFVLNFFRVVADAHRSPFAGGSKSAGEAEPTGGIAATPELSCGDRGDQGLF